MANFNGQLKQNEIFGAIYNMIISQQVFADNIAGIGDELVNRAKVDGGLYGDTKLYYATDALKSAPWGKDAEAAKVAYDKANSVLDKAVSSGIKKKNYASRQKSRLAKAVNSINA